jgi:hypothetical protein
MVPKFNEQIKFKIIPRWIKYVDIIMLNNDRVQKLKIPHNTPPTIPYLMHLVRRIDMYIMNPLGL